MSRQLLFLLLLSAAIFGGGANAMTYSLRGKDITSSIVLLLDPVRAFYLFFIFIFIQIK